MAEIVQQFNDESRNDAWPEHAFAALAGWFATQLPETYTHHDFDAGINPAAQTTIAITPEQRSAFATALAEEMRKIPPRKNRFGGEYIEIESTLDIEGNDAKAYPAVWHALVKAGITGAFIELEFTRSYIHKDGQVFFARGRLLEHPGRPDIEYTRESDVDFTGCPWMRQDSRYLVTPLQEGQTVTSVRRGKGATPTYHDYIAKEGDVLVIPAFACDDFASLTQNDALNLRYRDNIRMSLIGKASEYSDGAKTRGSTFEQLDNSGHFRRLSSPFQLFTASAPFATGCGSEYHVMKPGDCITREPEGEYGHHEVVLKEWMDSAVRVFPPCAPDGTLTDMTTLDKPVTASRPLKLKTPVEPT